MIWIVIIGGALLLLIMGGTRRTARATERMANVIAPRSLAYRVFNGILGMLIILVVLFILLGGK